MEKKFTRIVYGGKKGLGFKRMKRSNLSQRSFVKEIKGEPHSVYEMKRGKKIIKRHQEKLFPKMTKTERVESRNISKFPK